MDWGVHYSAVTEWQTIYSYQTAKRVALILRIIVGKDKRCDDSTYKLVWSNSNTQTCKLTPTYKNSQTKNTHTHEYPHSRNISISKDELYFVRSLMYVWVNWLASNTVIVKAFRIRPWASLLKLLSKGMRPRVWAQVMTYTLNSLMWKHVSRHMCNTISTKRNYFVRPKYV